MTVLTEIATRAREAASQADSATLAAAGWHVLDTMACVASGATHPLASRWLPLLPPGPPDEHEATGVTGHWNLATAVEIESTLAHLDEFDPLHAPAAVAPGAVTVPAATLVGAAQHATGDRVARAVIAGYEAVIETAHRFGGPALYAAGWWPTAMFGAIGSAAAAATLLDLNLSTTTTALAMAAAPLGGLLSADDLGDAHYLLCGRAAAHGVWAAQAAQAGLTASTSLLDKPATAALGRPATPPTSPRHPHIIGAALKKWPCARPLHAALAALDDLAADEAPLASGDITEIGLPSPALRFVTDQPRPTSPVDAAASAVVTVTGAAAGRAHQPGWYRAVAAGDATRPNITVRLRAEPELDDLFPDYWAADVTLQSNETTYHRRKLIAPGDPDQPLPEDDLIAKAAMLIGISESSPVLQRLLHLPTEPDTAALRVAVRQAGPRGRI